MKNNFKTKEIFIKIFDLLLNIYFIFLVSLFVTNYAFIFSILHKKFNFLPEDISNISVQIPIFMVLLFLRLLINSRSFKNIKFIKILKSFSNLNDKVILIIIFVVFLIIFLSIGIVRHFAFSSGGYDLGVYDHAIWNTTKGDILFSSLDGNVSHLGSHFEPILILIVPLYMLWPNVIVLIILQSLSLGFAIFPIYLIAKHRLDNRLLVFVFIVAYCLSRAVRGIGFLDFHPDSFLVPLIFCSYYFLVTKRTIAALLSLFLMLLCKEDAAFLIGAFGIFLCIFQKRYKLGIFLFLAGIAGWIVETSIIMPRFANTQNYPYLSWLPFGETYAQNINAVLQKPSLLIGLFFSPEKISFYLKLFGPLGFLSFLSPAHYVLFLVPLTEQVIGSLRHGGMQTITSHYPAHTLPFIFISAIYGAGWLVDIANKHKNFYRNKKIAFYLSIYIVLISLLFYGKTDGHKFAKFLKTTNELRSMEIISYLKTIPEDASVCAVNRLVPHLSHRKYIYVLETIKNYNFVTDYIVIHTGLVEMNKERIPDLLNNISQRGYKKIVSDDLFYIFFNPDADRSLLENAVAKLIPMTSADMKDE